MCGTSSRYLHFACMSLGNNETMLENIQTLIDQSPAAYAIADHQTAGILS